MSRTDSTNHDWLNSWSQLLVQETIHYFFIALLKLEPMASRMLRAEQLNETDVEKQIENPSIFSRSRIGVSLLQSLAPCMGGKIKGRGHLCRAKQCLNRGTLGKPARNF